MDSLLCVTIASGMVVGPQVGVHIKFLFSIMIVSCVPLN